MKETIIQQCLDILRRDPKIGPPMKGVQIMNLEKPDESKIDDCYNEIMKLGKWVPKGADDVKICGPILNDKNARKIICKRIGPTHFIDRKGLTKKGKLFNKFNCDNKEIKTKKVKTEKIKQRLFGLEMTQKTRRKFLINNYIKKFQKLLML